MLCLYILYVNNLFLFARIYKVLYFLYLYDSILPGDDGNSRTQLSRSLVRGDSGGVVGDSGE